MGCADTGRHAARGVEVGWGGGGRLEVGEWSARHAVVRNGTQPILYLSRRPSFTGGPPAFLSPLSLSLSLSHSLPLSLSLSPVCGPSTGNGNDGGNGMAWYSLVMLFHSIALAQHSLG